MTKHKALPSFFDRLVEPEVRTTENSLAPLVESIKKNLGWILTAIPGHSLACPAYGIESPLTLADQASRRRLEDEIKQKIRLFEPRILRARIEVSLDQQVRVTAQVAGIDREIQILLEPKGWQ